MIELTREIARQIGAEGEKTYPNECCGALFGHLSAQGDGRVTAIFPIVNARESEEQYHRFVITADDALRAERAALVEGVDVIGYYHSHPDHPAIPSEFDREHALPFYAYIIVAVAQRQAGALTSWRLTQDRLRFLQEEVHIVS
ncbi:Mov34/MPN/PAD-1 family protein [Klebsiella variicola]|uniref:Mov34/MPN/PAD-1 family protein n=1 Tax=Klebsiella variicola TaxID=244366 RepID=UPI000B3D2435|nr:M67 family metallopeptidase [Klebsiella variicola]HBR8101613.1 M67 family metallopeptidase [Klebsiella variicola subsp. variicola]AWA00553.1 M67 family metallopeptidase [Klebsiella variicola]MBV2200963.1 M67 family metallopeptidase [Klebsiella variicola]MCJ7049691.1 M67 family metallopeptidase [Klebsiella variicola]MDD9248949.1 M67 family metallopeptidase [Klebsiella variicola]